MSIAVQDVYQAVCFVCLEDLGFVLGVYSEAQFLNDLSAVLMEFSQQAALIKTIFTEMINAGVTIYGVPDDLLRPELCFFGGRLIEQVTEAGLAQEHFEWKRQWGPLRQWHQDNLSPKNIEVYPKPTQNGAQIGGPGPIIGTYGDFFPSQHNLSIVAAAAPNQTTWALGDTITNIPASFAHYIVYGVLEKIFSAEGETRDNQRAAYCRARFQEGVTLADAIANQEMLEDADDINP